MAPSIQDKISDMFASVSPRDRVIYLSLIGLVALSLVVFIAMLMSDTIEKKTEQVKKLEHQRMEAEIKLFKITEINKKNETYVKNFTDNKEDFQSFLEGQVNKLSLANNFKGAPITQNKQKLKLLEGKTYEVKMKNLGLENLSKLLHSLETSTYPLEIIKMKVKPNGRKDKLLNVTLNVSAYQMQQQEEENE